MSSEKSHDSSIRKHFALSLRMRLALGYASFFALALTLIGGGVFFSVRHTLFEEMERQLYTSSDLILQDFAQSDTSLTMYFSSSAFLLRTHSVSVIGLDAPALYVQVVTLSGETIVTSESLRHQQFPITRELLATIRQGASLLQSVQLAHGRVLMLARPIMLNGAPAGMLVVAHPMREVNRTLDLMLLSFIIIGPVALLSALRGGTLLARQALKPVQQVAQTTKQIVQAEDLARRVPTVPTSDEIGELTSTINAMLERLEQLFTMQRRFVADVSHELHTPLTAMRGNLDIIRRGLKRDPQALDESLADLDGEVGRLSRLTNDLLLLARAEAGLRLNRAPVALDDLVLDVVRTMHPMCQNLSLIPSIEAQVEMSGDYDRLKQALINLVANAIQYTPEQGTIRITLSHDQQNASIGVRDTGVGIAEEDIPHLFDRFYRTDRARSRRSGGSGIGLTIVKWVADSHGGDVTVQSSQGEGSTFTLVLPLGEQTEPPPVKEAHEPES